jgi:hypothetical protein
VPAALAADPGGLRLLLHAAVQNPAHQREGSPRHRTFATLALRVGCEPRSVARSMALPQPFPASWVAREWRAPFPGPQQAVPGSSTRQCFGPLWRHSLPTTSSPT